MHGWSMTNSEKQYLRELAKKQMEYSQLPIMREREKNWYLHNDLKGEIPMIHIETWTFEQDILAKPFCTSAGAKEIELQIKRSILNHEVIGDDRVVEDYFAVGWNIDFKVFNLNIEQEYANSSSGNNLGHKFIHPITDIESDIKKLEKSTFSVDKKKTEAWINFVNEAIGDILPVKLSMSSPSFCLTQIIVHLMGMENMIYSMLDYPEEFNELVKRITNDHIDYFKWMEKEGLLVLNNGSNVVSQGTFGFTKDLPSNDFNEKSEVKLKDVWGYMDSQETVNMAPDMFGEFFFPSYKKVSELFGLVNYGCCEPVNSIWDKYISTMTNLRKVSISPWCNEKFMGDSLKGGKVIYHRKPSPNFIGVGKEFDEEAFREHIRKTIENAKGCKLEFSFRDVYTLNGDMRKPRRAVEIVREEIERNWII